MKTPNRSALWLFAALSCFFVAITRGHFTSTDEIAVFEQTRSLWEHGDIDVPPMNNTYRGSNSRYYAVYSVGVSVAAVPFYATGKLLRSILGHTKDWVETFAGPVIGDANLRWGGELEMFSVDLVDAFACALLCTLFFSLAQRLGTSPKAACIATVFLATSSYLTGFSTGLFQHAFEALTLFASFYTLFADARAPHYGRRVAAGALAGAMLLVRFQSVIALPALIVYLLVTIWRRRQQPILSHLLVESIQFATPVVVGLLIHVAINWHKFGSPTLLGPYGTLHFNANLLVTLFGFLFSPGDSLFIFTPLLVLAPWYLPAFARRWSAEAFFILGLATSYLVFYGKYEQWHGQWCFGPRFLVASIPLLLLPLGLWWSSATPRWRLVAGGLAGLGALVQLLHVAVNFSYVYHAENYAAYHPPLGFLFIPGDSQLATHWTALRAGDYRVDMWLLNVYRRFGLGRFCLLAIPLLIGVLASAWQLRARLQQTPTEERSGE